MTRLILARHGNTFEEGQVPVQIGAKTDLCLTGHGKNQAERLADYLALHGAQLRGIYTGALKRQRETAQIIGDRFHLPVIQAPALTEIDYGDWEGLTSAEIELHWPREHKEWDRDRVWPRQIFKGSFESHWLQLEKWFDLLRQTYAPDDVVVGISSNGLLRFLRNEKVRTGHFCELELLPTAHRILHWNRLPAL